jgi:hypothetical protein
MMGDEIGMTGINMPEGTPLTPTPDPSPQGGGEDRSPAAPAARPPSEGQGLLDRLNAQSGELVALQVLVQRLRAGVYGTPAPSRKLVRNAPQPDRKTTFFGAVEIIAGNNAAAIRAIRSDAVDMARIFNVDLDAPIPEAEEEADVGTANGG